MGAIAASGRPDALKLFQDIIIASASIPGLYPAVMIDAESGGHRFHELHSDGGSASQILMMPQAILANGDRMPKIRHNRGKVNFYVIVNNALMPEFGTTPNRTFSVLLRAYSIFVKSQTQSALTALYNFSKLAGAGFSDDRRPSSIFRARSFQRQLYADGLRPRLRGTQHRNTLEKQPALQVRMRFVLYQPAVFLTRSGFSNRSAYDSLLS
jgi:hypothetical protein